MPERITQVRNATHQFLRGKESALLVSVAEYGNRQRAVPQTFIAGGYKAAVTIGGTPTAGAYTLTVAGTPYTYTATGAETNTVIRDALLALVNAGSTGVLAVNPQPSSGSRLFDLARATTFTAAGTATSPGTLTVGSVTSTAAPAKGATTIALVAPALSDIQTGNVLMFIDTTGGEYLARVSAVAVAGATSLTVSALDEAIPDGATAEFPIYIWNRTDTGISRKYNIAKAVDYNTGSASDGIADTADKSMAAPGNYYNKNAGYLTVRFAAELGYEVILERRFPPPSAKYSTGDTIWTAALCSDRSDQAPANGFVSADLSFEFLGEEHIIDPIPV